MIKIKFTINDITWTESGIGSPDIADKLSVALDKASDKVVLPDEKDKLFVHILLCDDTEIQSFNKEFREIDKPTNVLSLEINENISDGDKTILYLGDIALSLDTIKRESEEYSMSFIDHVFHMLIHGFLHLLGYDHNNDKNANDMESLETSILSELGISNPYEDTVSLDCN